MRLFIIIFSIFAFADNSLHMSLRESQTQFDTYCQSIDCQKVDIIAKEFSNENTYVRLNQSVSGKNISIHIPNELTSNGLMELLIKIRTVQQGLAKTIDIISFDPQKTVSLATDNELLLSHQQIMDLVAIAGANFFNSSAIRARAELASLPYSFDLSTSLVVDAGVHPRLAQSLADQLHTRVASYKNLAEIQREQTVLLVTAPSTPVNENLFRTLHAISEVKKVTSHIVVISPYLPYARSDKVDHAGVTITGRLIADMIELFGATAVQFVRAHAPQSQGFFSIPSIETKSRETINAYLISQNVEMIVSPDAGFQKDATLFAEELGLPLGVVNKQRDLLTGESRIHNMSGYSPRRKVVAIVDDETASGGTLAKVAQFLKSKGAKKIIAVVTHLAGSADQALSSPYINTIATTDTLPITTNFPKLVVLPIAPEIVSDLMNFIPTSRLPLSNNTQSCREIFSQGSL